MSEMSRQQELRGAFMDGARMMAWGQDDQKRAAAEAFSRYPDPPLIVQAPSGRFYRTVTRPGEAWLELRRYQTREEAVKGDSVGSAVGVLHGDEKAAAGALLGRPA